MTCHGCVQTAMGVLGDTATVTLATQAATRPVPSMAVAKALTEELEDVGLAAALVALEEVLPNDDAIKAHGEERMNSQQLNAGAGTATTDSICDAPQPAATQSQTVELMVGGMTCAMCSRAITQSLLALPGVINVAVSLATNVATVEYTTTGSATATQASEQMKVAIESVGYEVTQILSKRQDTKLEQLTQRQQQDVGLKKICLSMVLGGDNPNYDHDYDIASCARQLIRTANMATYHSSCIQTTNYARVFNVVGIGFTGTIWIWIHVLSNIISQCKVRSTWNGRAGGIGNNSQLPVCMQ